MKGQITEMHNQKLFNLFHLDVVARDAGKIHDQNNR